MAKQSDTAKLAYKQSRSITNAKNVDEALDKNFTSDQLLTILDNLLYAAIKPLVKHTYFLDRVLADALPATAGSRKQVSHIGNDQAVVNLSLFLVSKNTGDRMRLLRATHLDRSLYFLAIQLFLAYTQPYRALYHELHCTQSFKRKLHLRRQIQVYELGIQLRRTAHLYTVIQHVEYYYKQAELFKKVIAEKYLRLAVNQAVAFNKRSSTFNIDLDDVMQNHALSLARAINRCSAHKGTLTSYITSWFKEIKSRKSHFVQLPENVSLDTLLDNDYDAVNMLGSGHALTDEGPQQSVQLSDLALAQLRQEEDASIPIERETTAQIVRKLARYADPDGLGRFVLGLTEELTPAERKALAQQHAIE